jgi:hypothetical protein
VGTSPQADDPPHSGAAGAFTIVHAPIATGSGTITGTCTSSFTIDVATCTERWDGKTVGF